MGNLSDGLKIKYSFYSALVFFLLSSPTVYLITSSLSQNLIGIPLANDEGCPTALGLMVHTAVFFKVLYMMMKLPKDKYD